MARKPTGPVALTPAERQAKRRQKLVDEAARSRNALARVLTARTIAEARRIAQDALKELGNG